MKLRMTTKATYQGQISNVYPNKQSHLECRNPHDFERMNLLMTRRQPVFGAQRRRKVSVASNLFSLVKELLLSDIYASICSKGSSPRFQPTRDPRQVVQQDSATCPGTVQFLHNFFRNHIDIISRMLRLTPSSDFDTGPIRRFERKGDSHNEYSSCYRTSDGNNDKY